MKCTVIESFKGAQACILGCLLILLQAGVGSNAYAGNCVSANAVVATREDLSDGVGWHCPLTPPDTDPTVYPKLTSCCGVAYMMASAGSCWTPHPVEGSVDVGETGCEVERITNSANVVCFMIHSPKKNGQVKITASLTIDNCPVPGTDPQEYTTDSCSATGYLDVELPGGKCEDDDGDDPGNGPGGCGRKCKKSESPSPGAGRVGNHSVEFQLDLGQATMFETAGYISLSAEVPSTSMATPTALTMPFRRTNVEILTNGSGVIQQVKTPRVLVNVTTAGSYKYYLQVFSTNNLSGYKTNGLYGTNGSAFVTWVVQNPDTNYAYNRLWITEQRTGLADRPFKFSYTNNSTNEHRWDLLEPDGVTTISRWRLTNPTNSAMTNLYYQVTSGADILEASCTTVQAVPRVDGHPSDGVLKTSVVYGSGNITQATYYVYYPTNAASGSANRLKRVDNWDGSWVYYQYDAAGRVTNEFSTFLNYEPPTNKDTEPDPLTDHCKVTTYTFDDSMANPFLAHQTIVSIPDASGQMQEISRRYRRTAANYSEDQKCTLPGAGENNYGNLFSYTYSYDSSDPASAGRVQSISHPDGTATDYSYILTDTNFTTIESHGETDTWSIPTPIINGTETTTVIDVLGRTQSRVVKRIENYTVGITLSQQIYVYSSVDPLGRDYYVYDLAGRTNYYEFACCGLNSETDPDGVGTVYTYDIMRNVVGTSAVRGSAFITISNAYDGLGRSLVTRRIGEDAGTNIMTLSQQKYDVLGRINYETNALGGVSSNSYAIVNYRSCITNYYPDGGTRVEVYCRDGRLQSVSGSAVSPVQYQYGVEYVDGYWREYTLETKLTSTGGTNEWVKTFSDAAGRVIKTVYPSTSGEVAAFSYYDQNVPGGQLVRQVDPDGVTTLFAYNGEGERTIQAVDMNQDTYIDYYGVDRITMTTNEVVSAHGTDVLRRSTYVWATDYFDTPLLVSSVDRTPDGQHTWSIVWNNGVAVTSETHRLCNVGNGYCITTNVAPDGSYTVTTNRYGRIVSQTLRASNGSQIGQMTFGYDTHGRQNTVTDARTGTTTNWFNTADQIVSTKTPIPATGQSAQVTTNLVDTMGRILKTILPDNTSVTNKYDVTGLLTNTAGSRTYPVAYTYDAQGRMKTMKTWQDFANNSGAATTTWNYDVYRGSLTNKMYDGGASGPVYAYTPAGRLASRTWARGIVTTYHYDNAGGLAVVEYSDTTPAVTNSYDRRGRLVEVVCDGMTNSMSYSDAGMVLGEAYTGGLLDGLSVTNGYDQYLRRTNLTLRNSSSALAATSYGYDNASRIALVASGTEKAVYSYLANSPLVEKIWFTNNTTLRMTTTKSYDNLDRLTGIASSAGGSNVAVFNYTYNSANQRTAITNVDSSRWVYQYDSLGQVIAGKKYWSDGMPVAGQQFEYGFDDIGNRKVAATGGDATGANLRYANYTNNALNQITSREVSRYVSVLGSASNNATVTLWGDNGSYSTTSRKSEYFRGELSVTNTANAVWLTITNQAVLNNGSNPDLVTNTIGKSFIPMTAEVFSYDLDGNLTNDGRWVYTWDAENRLVQQESLSNAPTSSKYQLKFAYDSKGKRIQKLVSTNNGSAYVAQYTNRFMYDGWNLSGILAPNSQLLSAFTWGVDLSGGEQGAGGAGGLLMSYIGAATNCFSYDGNGNIAAIVNMISSDVAAAYEYGPFGELIRLTGALAKRNPFRFSTKYQDDESGGFYYGYRYYDSAVGRWFSRDPFDESGAKTQFGFGGIDEADEDVNLNLYRFSKNIPISVIDRFGLAAQEKAQEKKCNCECEGVEISYTPKLKDNNLQFKFYRPHDDKDKKRYGFILHIKWKVKGKGKLCQYGFQEPSGGVSGSTPKGTVRTSRGTEGQWILVKQSIDDNLGINVDGKGQYSINVNLTQSYACWNDGVDPQTQSPSMTVGPMNFKGSGSAKY